MRGPSLVFLVISGHRGKVRLLLLDLPLPAGVYGHSARLLLASLWLVLGVKLRLLHVASLGFELLSATLAFVRCCLLLLSDVADGRAQLVVVCGLLQLLLLDHHLIVRLVIVRFAIFFWRAAAGRGKSIVRVPAAPAIITVWLIAIRILLVVLHDRVVIVEELLQIG